MSLVKYSIKCWLFALLLVTQWSCTPSNPYQVESIELELSPGTRIAMVGNTLGERMQYFGHFESLLHQTHPTHQLVVRNLCWPADTPSLRPRSQGVDPDQELREQQADVLFAFFGFNESFEGADGLAKFEQDLEAFIQNPLRLEKSNTALQPKVILFSPIAFENLSATQKLPDGNEHNQNLALYTAKMREVTERNNIYFIDLFHPTQKLFKEEAGPWTINGCHLNDRGYQKLAQIIHFALFGQEAEPNNQYELLRAMVNEKSFQFRQAFRPVNGIHVYGERVYPFGNINFPPELKKLQEMTANRDRRIWEIAQGKTTSLEIDDSNTTQLPSIDSNYPRPTKYLSAAESKQKFKLPEDFEINLFASEEEFPELANPVQMSFDDRGRLWVSVMPTYPHYLPGDPPSDKILIFEDTNGDGKADKQTVFADKLYLPIGFEFANGGVYVSQQPNLVFLKDTDGDNRADVQEIVLHGFSSHDAHHAISAFTADASGAIFMLEGFFLYTQVETPYGPVRGKDGVVYRFEPDTWRLEAVVRFNFWNPWGIAFNEWGQSFIADASDGENFSMNTIMTTLPYGVEHQKDLLSITENNMVRPTSGAEIVSSGHFPAEMQGDLLLNNTIGFLGTRQHILIDSGAGFRTELRQDLISSTDPNFRPVDMEFAPDGSLYVVDWHNALIGHMQHSIRDPKRDHRHGRIWRVTHKRRPLLTPVSIEGASVDELMELLKSAEYRTRYRVRRALKRHDTQQVLAAVKAWSDNLSPSDKNYDRHLLEALNVSWSHHAIDPNLLERNLNSGNFNVRAAAVRILRHSWRNTKNYETFLLQAAQDQHPRVRLEALIAASNLPPEQGVKIATLVAKQPTDYFLNYALAYSMIPLRPYAKTALAQHNADIEENKQVLQRLIDLQDPSQKKKAASTAMNNIDADTWKLGEAVYSRDAHCGTCHQSIGTGITDIYPPLMGSEWVMGNEERLIKLVLDGLIGEITVKGVTYKGESTPPMTPFRHIITDDEEMAAVLTYIRNSWGNEAPAISPETVKRVREETRDRNKFWTAAELLQQHPL